MKTTIPYLYLSRHGIFYYRLHTKAIDKKISLRTRCKNKAIQRAHEITESLVNFRERMTKDFRKDVERMRDLTDWGDAVDSSYGFKIETCPSTKSVKSLEFTDVNSEDDHKKIQELLGALGFTGSTPSSTATKKTIQSRSEAGVKFSEFVSKYQESADFCGNSYKTQREKINTWSIFKEMHNDPLMRTIDKAMLQDFKEHLLSESKGLATSSAKKKFSAMKTLLDYAEEGGYIDDNPCPRKLTNSRSAKVKTTSWDRFSSDELQKIFAPSIYPLRLRFDSKKGSYFWVPLVLVLSGARVNEICQLSTADVIFDTGIPHLRIDDEIDENESSQVKSIKNHNSRRKVPIHPVLISLGFEKFVQQMRVVHRNKAGQIFLNLKYDQSNGYTKNVSRNFHDKILKPLGIYDNPKKRLRSFRATFIKTMSEHGADPYVLKTLVGHYQTSAVDLDSAHSTNYNHSHTMESVLGTLGRLPVSFLNPLSEAIGNKAQSMDNAGSKH